MPSNASAPLEIRAKGSHHRAYRSAIGSRLNARKGSYEFPPTPSAAATISKLPAVEFFGESERRYRALLEEMSQRRRQNRLRDTLELSLADPARHLHFPLWRHQQAVVAWTLPLRSALWHLGMGTGKTAATIRLIKERGHAKVLVVCPKPVIRTWIDELEKHANYKYAAKPIDGNKNLRLRRVEEIYLQDYYEGPRIAVVNYESLWRPKEFAEFLLVVGIDFVIFDECQRLRSPGGKASRFAEKLAERIPWKLGLSGTPEPQSPADTYGVFRALEPGIFGRNFKGYLDRYAVMGGYENREIVAWRNEEDYAARRGQIVFRIRTEDAVDLPETQHRVVEVRMSDDTQRIYAELRDEFVTEKSGGRLTADHALTRLLRLQQLTSGRLEGDDGEVLYTHRGKTSAFEGQMCEIESDEPVLVFCRFKWDVRRVKEICKKLGRKAFELSGPVNELKDWQTATGGEVLVANIKSGAEGIDCTRSRYCIYFSIGYSLGEYEQSLARIHRPGQTRGVVYIHLVTTGAVDQSIYRALRKRRDVLDYVIGEAGGAW